MHLGPEIVDCILVSKLRSTKPVFNEIKGYKTFLFFIFFISANPIKKLPTSAALLPVDPWSHADAPYCLCKLLITRLINPELTYTLNKNLADVRVNEVSQRKNMLDMVNLLCSTGLCSVTLNW